MDTKLLAVVVIILLGVSGFIVTYLNNLRLDKRKDRFAFLSKQIGELYGPLYVATQANEISLRLYKSNNGGHIFKDIDYPSEAEVKAWVSYFKKKLFPINEVIEKLIIDNSHLVIEDGMPIHFQEFITHIVSCRLMFQKWNEVL